MAICLRGSYLKPFISVDAFPDFFIFYHVVEFTRHLCVRLTVPVAEENLKQHMKLQFFFYTSS